MTKEIYSEYAAAQSEATFQAKTNMEESTFSAQSSANDNILDVAKADFLAFLEENKDTLDTGFGAFHTNGHSNW